ncbi:hypothetical protein CEXT_197581 [Caerostris extrusa]|uniref:Uncharacterized protein n=1 Tax=Caerostris extrusa TaxID=172846 RepID=A0AAV4Y536_CAEEX|nr:hypothetical protein CEXT_197581 [Caerostris extrusa]
MELSHQLKSKDNIEIFTYYYYLCQAFSLARNTFPIQSQSYMGTLPSSGAVSSTSVCSDIRLEQLEVGVFRCKIVSGVDLGAEAVYQTLDGTRSSYLVSQKKIRLYRFSPDKHASTSAECWT